MRYLRSALYLGDLAQESTQGGDRYLIKTPLVASKSLTQNLHLSGPRVCSSNQINRLCVRVRVRVRVRDCSQASYIRYVFGS